MTRTHRTMPILRSICTLLALKLMRYLLVIERLALAAVNRLAPWLSGPPRR